MQTAQQPERATNVRWTIFALACAASWLLYLHRYSWGVVKPDFARENPELSATDLGWLDSAFQATYGLGQVPGGLAGDFLGARGVLAGSIAVWSLTVAGVAWVAGFWALWAVRAAFGLAQAAAYPVLNKVTRTWFPLGVRTSVQGTVTAMGRVGAACAPVVVATFLMAGLGFSWQAALLLLGLPGLLLAGLFWAGFRNRPDEHPWANPAECRLLAEGNAPAGAGRRPRLLMDGWGALSLAMLLVYAFASTFQDQLYVNWIPMFLEEGRQLDRETMGLFAPLPLLGGALGGVAGGLLNDALIRAGLGRRWVRSGVACAGKAVAAALVFLSVQVEDGRLAMVVLLAARFFGDWSLATVWGAITDVSGRAAATVFALVNTAGAVGAFLANPTLGYLKDTYDWEGVFVGVAAVCLASALTWLFIDCTRPLVADE